MNTPKRQPVVRLSRDLASNGDLAAIRDNLSAMVLAGEHLWMGGDEGTSIDRFRRDGADFGKHRRFDLAPMLKLEKDGSEIDIEGLDEDAGYLWLIGSHSLKRQQPSAKKSPEENRARLSNVTPDANRQTFARVPITKDSEPAAEAGALRAARLDGDNHGSALYHALAADDLFKPFIGVPSKDNGIDIEGLAMAGDRVFVGMRGPVFRGWAVVLEFKWADAGRGALKLGSPLRKHFLDLDGLGVRELSIEGKDMYILAGPTMDLDGPVHIFRWRKALNSAAEALVPRAQLDRVVDVPYGVGKTRGFDHAEGITLIRRKDRAPQVMVCYDSPAKTRFAGKRGVRLDVFSL